jgi:hypothetical protein
MSGFPHYFVFLANPSRGLAGGGEIFTGQVHLKVSQPLLLLRLRPSYGTSDFRYNDVSTAVPGPTRDALGLDLEAVPAEQIPATKCCAGGRSSCRAIGALSLAGPRFMSANMSDFRS